MNIKVISGAQIGADIAGLRAAHKTGLETGGWMPMGYRTLLEPLPLRDVKKYGLLQTKTSAYPPRTRQNVVDSDATIRFAHHWYTAGERLTQNLLIKNSRPRFDVELRKRPLIENPRKFEWSPYGFDDDHVEAFSHVVSDWVRETVPDGGVLNIAGNADLSIEKVVEEFLVLVFEQLKGV